MKKRHDKIAVTPRVAKLLREVQRDITENYLRFDMEQWVNPEDSLAPCGTTACIAGFIHIRHIMSSIRKVEGHGFRVV